jgi:nitrogen regulatory protein P-II 1
MALKRIEAVIRPEKLEPLRQLLEETGYPGMMVTEIEGHGKQRGVEQQWRGNRYRTVFLPKIKVEIIASDKKVKKLIDVIVDVCRSGSVGDGKIFISPVTDAIRIRTKEKGEKAIH